MKFESDLDNLKKSIKKPFESNVGKEEKLRTYFCIYFKEKALISAPGDKDIFVLDNNNKEISELLTRYGVLSNLIWQMDPQIEKDFLETENNLRSLSRPLKKEDFLYVKDVTDKDLKLFYEIFKYNAVGFEIQTWGVGLDEMLLFLRYAEKCNDEDLKRILNFKEKFKITPFLSIISGGKEIGDKILTLGEKLPENVAREVFKKYGEIINTVDNCEDEIRKIFGEKKVPVRVLASVKETLLKRGAKMLSDLGDNVSSPDFKINEQEILKELDEIKEESIILGKSFEKLYREGINVPIEDVTTTKETPAEKLTQEQKIELMSIYEKGRPKVTYESKEHLEFLKKEFEEELNNKDIFVNEICFKDQTVIIALVDKKDQDNLYVGGLTFVDEVKNAVVAEATISYLIKKSKDKNIRALVDSRNPLLNMYLKRFGFKITKKLDSEEEIKNNKGEIYYEIEKNKEIQQAIDPARGLNKAA